MNFCFIKVAVALIYFLSVLPHLLVLLKKSWWVSIFCLFVLTLRPLCFYFSSESSSIKSLPNLNKLWLLLTEERGTRSTPLWHSSSLFLQHSPVCPAGSQLDAQLRAARVNCLWRIIFACGDWWNQGKGIMNGSLVEQVSFFKTLKQVVNKFSWSFITSDLCVK